MKKAETCAQLPVHGLFEHQVALTPLRSALEYDGSRFTYEAINTLADRFAGYLTEEGVRSGCGVAVSLRRSEWLIISLLAILKCGAYYVPISPDHPKDWRTSVVRDSDAVLLITDENPGGEAVPVRHVSIKGYRSLAREDSARLTRSAPSSDENTCYLLYTSGTTGQPKGVPISHRSVSHLLWALGERLGVTQDDRWLAATTLTFDIAALEWFMPLTSGATIILSTDEESRSPLALRKVLFDSGATILQGTPALWRILLEAGPLAGSLRILLCGGDTLSADLASRLVKDPSKTVWNLYGPTETTIWSTAYCLTGRTGDDKPPIGSPLGETELHILDANLTPVPAGEVGELFIGGPGVSSGYWQRPDLTANAFFDALSSVSQARLYRTGDLVRTNVRGELEFIGRGDRQAKIRGYRIELAEVEAVILGMPGIEAAVAAIRHSQSGDARLWAFVAVRQGIEMSATEIRSYISIRLPEYKVPSGFVRLKTIPLTANGKVDHQVLLESLASGSPNELSDAPEPGNQTERRLSVIWAAELGLATLGTSDDFFALGGDSMFAAMIMIRIAEEFGVQMTLDDFLENPTIAALATFVDRRGLTEVGTTAASDVEARMDSRS